MLKHGKRYAYDLEKDIATNKNLSSYFIEAAKKGSLIVIPRKDTCGKNEYWWEEPRESENYTGMFTVTNEAHFQKCLTLIEDEPKARPESIMDIEEMMKMQMNEERALCPGCYIMRVPCGWIYKDTYNYGDGSGVSAIAMVFVPEPTEAVVWEKPC